MAKTPKTGLKMAQKKVSLEEYETEVEIVKDVSVDVGLLVEFTARPDRIYDLWVSAMRKECAEPFIALPAHEQLAWGEFAKTVEDSIEIESVEQL